MIAVADNPDESRYEVRSRNLAVLPFCPFVKGYIERHPEYLDLVPAAKRDDFGLG